MVESVVEKCEKTGAIHYSDSRRMSTAEYVYGEVETLANGAGESAAVVGDREVAALHSHHRQGRLYVLHG